MDGLTQQDASRRDLRRRVENSLRDDGRPSLRRLEVEIHGGAAVVKGRVRTYYEKQLATCCCQRVVGVLRVINEVQVAE